MAALSLRRGPVAVRSRGGNAMTKPLDFVAMVEEKARKRERNEKAKAKAKTRAAKKRTCTPLEFRKHLQGDSETADFVGFNELANEIVLIRNVSWLEGGAPRAWQDFDDAGLVQYFNGAGFARVAKSIVHDVVDLEA